MAVLGRAGLEGSGQDYRRVQKSVWLAVTSGEEWGGTLYSLADRVKRLHDHTLKPIRPYNNVYVDRTKVTKSYREKSIHSLKNGYIHAGEPHILHKKFFSEGILIEKSHEKNVCYIK